MATMDRELVIDGIHGPRTDPALAERLHALSHSGAVETLQIAPQDLPRRRFRAVTDRGTACFVALARSEPLFDGAVLHLDDTRAVVVRVGDQRWLRLLPVDTAAALELGYHAGNLHWRIRFDGSALLVAADGPDARYLDRVRPLLDSGRVRLHG
jgi:urease accessory protein